MVLMPTPLRVARGAERRWPAVDQDLAGVAPAGAAQDLHERRLPCPVLPEQGVHFTAPQLEAHVVERDDAGEDLADAAHLEHRGNILIAHGGSTVSS